MRKDQIERLTEISEKLADVFIEEANPDNWPGSDKPISKLSAQERGDRYWNKKNAAMTLTVVMKAVNLVGVVQQQKKAPDDPADDGDLDKEIRQAEREAEKVLARIQQDAGKAEFTKRANGKR